MNHSTYQSPTDKELAHDDILDEWQNKKLKQIIAEKDFPDKLPKQDKVDNPIMREKMLKAERELNETLKQIEVERRHANIRPNKPNL